MGKGGSRDSSDTGSRQGSDGDTDTSFPRDSVSGSVIGDAYGNINFPGGAPSVHTGKGESVHSEEVDIEERLDMELKAELLRSIKQILATQSLSQPKTMAQIPNTLESNLSVEQAMMKASQIEKENDIKAHQLCDAMMEKLKKEQDHNIPAGKNNQDLISLLEDKINKVSVLKRAKRKITVWDPEQEDSEGTTPKEIVQEGYYYAIEIFDPTLKVKTVKHYFYPSTDEAKFKQLQREFGLKTTESDIRSHEAAFLNDKIACEVVDDMYKTIAMSIINLSETLKSGIETGKDLHQLGSLSSSNPGSGEVAAFADVAMVASLYCRARQYALAQKEREEADRMHRLAEKFKNNEAVAKEYRNAEENFRKKSKYNFMAATVGLAATGSYLGSGTIELVKDFGQATCGILGKSLNVIAPGLTTVVQIGVISVKNKRRIAVKGEIDAAENCYKYFRGGYPTSNPDWQAFTRTKTYLDLIAEPNFKKNTLAQEMNLSKTELHTLISLHQQKVLGEKLALFFWGESKPELRTLNQSLFIQSVELALSTVGATHGALIAAGAASAGAGVGTAGLALIPVALGTVILGAVSYYKAKKQQSENKMTAASLDEFAPDDSFPRMMAQLYEAVKMEQITYAKIEETANPDKYAKAPAGLSYHDTADKGSASSKSISAPFNITAKGIKPFSNMVELCLGISAADFVQMIELAQQADDKLELERLNMGGNSKRKAIIQKQRADATLHAMVVDQNPQFKPPVVQYVGVDGNLIEMQTNSLQYSAFSRVSSEKIQETEKSKDPQRVSTPAGISDKAHKETKQYQLEQQMKAQNLKQKYEVNIQALKHAIHILTEELSEDFMSAVQTSAKDPVHLTDLQKQLIHQFPELKTTADALDSLYEQLNTAQIAALNALDEWVETGAIQSKFYETSDSAEKKIKMLFDMVDKNKEAIDKQIEDAKKIVSKNKVLKSQLDSNNPEQMKKSELRQHLSLAYDERRRKSPSTASSSSAHTPVFSDIFQNIVSKGNRYMEKRFSLTRDYSQLATQKWIEQSQQDAEDKRKMVEMYRARTASPSPSQHPKADIDDALRRIQKYFNEEDDVIKVKQNDPLVFQGLQNELEACLKANAGNLDTVHRALLALIRDLEKPPKELMAENPKYYFFSDPARPNLIVQCKQLATDLSHSNRHLLSDEYRKTLGVNRDLNRPPPKVIMAVESKNTPSELDLYLNTLARMKNELMMAVDEHLAKYGSVPAKLHRDFKDLFLLMDTDITSKKSNAEILQHSLENIIHTFTDVDKDSKKMNLQQIEGARFILQKCHELQLTLIRQITTDKLDDEKSGDDKFHFFP